MLTWPQLYVNHNGGHLPLGRMTATSGEDESGEVYVIDHAAARYIGSLLGPDFLFWTSVSHNASSSTAECLPCHLALGMLHSRKVS